MLAVSGAKPYIHRGCFKAPEILADDPDYSSILNHISATARPDQSPFAGGVDAAKLGPDFVENTEGAQFWAKQKLPDGFLREQQEGNAGDDCVPMDIDGDQDEEEEDLMESQQQEEEGAPTTTTKKHRDVNQVFHEIRERIGTRARLGQTTLDAKVYRLQFPEGLPGKYLSTKIPNMALMIQSGERTMQRDAEGIVASSMMLCPPVHVSPLFMALNRDFQPCQTITDAITSIMRLNIVRLLLMHTDTSDPTHKHRANKYRQALFKTQASTYFGRVDTIIAKGAEPVEKREEQDPRKFYANLVGWFGLESDRYAMALIHIVEWNILDILHIPYAMRAGLMTPNLIGERVDPRTCMSTVSFQILRANLCNYTRNRNEVFCMKYVVDQETGRYKTTKIIDPDAWQPMHLDEPRIEDRLTLLEAYQKNKPVANAEKLMFGLYHNWISMQTLREFLMFLSTDTRPKRNKKELRPTAALHQEMDRETKEEEQQQSGE
jgi:hypothetical protein